MGEDETREEWAEPDSELVHAIEPLVEGSTGSIGTVLLTG